MVMAPTVSVMPGPNKPFAQFAADQQACQGYANSQTAPLTAQANNQALGSALLTTALSADRRSGRRRQGCGHRRRLRRVDRRQHGRARLLDRRDEHPAAIDIYYSQCMSARGNQFPGFSPNMYASALSRPGRTAASAAVWRATAPTALPPLIDDRGGRPACRETGGIRPMAKTRGTGLLMVWADIDLEYEADYHRWYDEEHIARLLAVPGFLSAGRYVALKGGPKNLALYELETAEALRTSAFLDEVRFRPSAKRVAASGCTIGRNYLINGYRQIFPMHTNPMMTQRHGTVSADGPDRHPVDRRGRIQQLVQHRLHPTLSRGARLPWRAALRRHRLAAQISDLVRIRERPRLRE
jgi:hypothetical protein